MKAAVRVSNNFNANQGAAAPFQNQGPIPFPNQRSKDWETYFAPVTVGKMLVEAATNRSIFQQGEPADSVFYLRQGKVKLSVTSEEGKEGIFSILDAGELFGEGCLAGQPVRMSTASALTDCTLVRIDKAAMTRLLREQPGVAELLAMNLLQRSSRYEEDLVDQLFNTSERRLARSLVLLAHVGNETATDPIPVLPKVNQETLAQMVGTTRSRVSHFMNKFRQRGFVDYNTRGELVVHSKLLRTVSGYSAA